AAKEISDITSIVIAGNTVMQHILAGISPVSIGKAPFKPESLFGNEYAANELFPEMLGSAKVFLLNCISGYVGGDITAGLLATDALSETGLRLFMDLGTNGEMALGNKDGYLTCATATGPVFEGAEISCGMEATEGAIDKVWAEKGDIKARVIGEVKPSGLCGSGLIDAVSVLLELGIVKQTGEIVPENELPATCRADYRIFTLKDGKRAVRIMGDIYVSADDIEKFQLAKAAVRAGIETLLKEMGKTVKDVTSVVIAGGFGNAINIESAVKIDLIPDIKRKMIWSSGNAAGYGAVLALNESRRDELKKIAEKCGYIELSESEVFKENYVRNMAF
nr:ASKHA domain-containing protein [Lachnospiraceae bacterium]